MQAMTNKLSMLASNSYSAQEEGCLGESRAIFTISNHHSFKTHFKGANMPTQRVLQCFKILRPFVSMILANFENSKHFLGDLEK